MKAHRLACVLPCLIACGAASSAPAPQPPPLTPASATPAQSATTSPSATVSVAPALPPPPATYEAEMRQILDEMVAVDTSHGHETALLEPIAERYRRAGVPVQILESSPGRGNLVARLKGSGAKKPIVLLAHVDVVPVEGQPWTLPAFTPTEKDGFLSGRGVNDDKSMAAAIVAVTLEMARAKTPLARDVIVALTAGEETGGFAGARWLTEKHRDLLDAEIALNEGGWARLSDDLSKVEQVGVGVSEKVFQSYKLVARGQGGHSSQPPTTGDPVVSLAHALVKVGEYRFPARVLPEIKAEWAASLATAKPDIVEALRHAVASAPRLDPADDKIIARNKSYNAVVRTTCVATMLQGSPQDNVLPTTAEATINCRILPGETRAATQAALEKVIGDAKIEITAIGDFGDAASSPAEGEVMDAVKKVARSAWGDVPVVATMGTGATDSRFLRGIGIRAYGFGPLAVSRADAMAGHAAHGPDERRPIKWIPETARVFREVVRTLAM